MSNRPPRVAAVRRRSAAIVDAAEPAAAAAVEGAARADVDARAPERPKQGVTDVPRSRLAPPPQPLSADARKALIDGAHVDPHAVLGPHPVTVDGAVATQVRALIKDAFAVTVVWQKDGREQRTQLTRDGQHGLFEGIVPAAGIAYQLEVKPLDGAKPRRVEDPYRFPPTVDEMQVYLFKAGQLEDTAKLLGAHPMKVDGVTGFNVVVWAPNARGVAVVGDFNHWEPSGHMMRRLHDSVFEVFVPGAHAGDAYKLSVTGADGARVLKADPAARSSQMRPFDASILVGADAHVWSDAKFLAARAAGDPLKQPLSTYEVHLPSWKKNDDGTMKNYRELADELAPHVVKHGFTSVELVGLAEHPLDDSWGYQVTGYYAPTSRHGTPEDFKYFVDKMHAVGVKVIYDWVPAHFPKDAHGLATFDGTHLFDHQDARLGEHKDWGTRIFNYGRNEVKSFLTGSLMHMLEEFHIDGVRVDAVASMLYLDYSRDEWIPNKDGGNENLEAIAFLKEVNARVGKRFKGVLKIAEESTSFAGVTKSVDEGGLGFDLKWNMGWMHDTLEFFKSHPDDRAARLDVLTNTLTWAHTEKFVAALSHDEVVHLKKSLLQKMPGDDWQKHANLRLLYAYMTSYPGQKLLFMGAELAQATEWNFKEALPWRDADAGTARLLADLNKLYASEPALSERQHDPEGTELRIHDPQNAVVGLVRKGDRRADDVLFVHNLTAVPRESYRIGVDGPGTYDEIFNSDAAVYGGSNMGNLGGVKAEKVPMHGKPYSIEVTLPPLGSVAWKKHGAAKKAAPTAEASSSSSKEPLPDTGKAHAVRSRRTK